MGLRKLGVCGAAFLDRRFRALGVPDLYGKQIQTYVYDLKSL